MALPYGGNCEQGLVIDWKLVLRLHTCFDKLRFRFSQALKNSEYKWNI